MYKIWTLELEEGGVDHFMSERDALLALQQQEHHGPYKATAIPKQGFSEHPDFAFVIPTK